MSTATAPPAKNKGGRPKTVHRRILLGLSEVESRIIQTMADQAGIPQAAVLREAFWKGMLAVAEQRETWKIFEEDCFSWSRPAVARRMALQRILQIEPTEYEARKADVLGVTEAEIREHERTERAVLKEGEEHSLLLAEFERWKEEREKSNPF